MSIVLASELVPKLGEDAPEDIDSLWDYIHAAESEVSAYLGVDSLDEKLETMVLQAYRHRSSMELPRGFVSSLISVNYGAELLSLPRFTASGWTLEFALPSTSGLNASDFMFGFDSAYVIQVVTGWRLSTVPNRVRTAVLELAATRFRNPDVVFEEQVGDVRNRYTAAFDVNSSLPVRVTKLLRDYRRVVI